MYWLSKYGFECARLDHTGIDLIARNPRTHEIMGISVKSRSRRAGTEHDNLRIPADHFDRAKKACRAFNCVPYFAFVMDAGSKIRVFILAMSEMLKTCKARRKSYAWNMKPKDIEQYSTNPKIVVFVEFTNRTDRWFSKC